MRCVKGERVEDVIHIFMVCCVSEVDIFSDIGSECDTFDSDVTGMCGGERYYSEV